MGSYKFRLSDMVPNAWFYKLRDMGASRKKASLKKSPTLSSTSLELPSQSSDQLCNYERNMDNQLPDHPRKTIYKPSSRVDKAIPSRRRYSSIPTYSPDKSSSDESLPSEEDKDSLVSCQTGENLAYTGRSCSCIVDSCNKERIIGIDDASLGRKQDKFYGFSKVQLPPILTKPEVISGKKTSLGLGSNSRRTRSEYEEVRRLRPQCVKLVKEKSGMELSRDKKRGRKSLSSSSGIRLRSNSPRIVTRKLHNGVRKSLLASSMAGPVLESFAMVKSSADPEEDFKQSMIEMIVENNIRKSEDLEELLICYLSLNSNEYYDSIVKAYEQTCLKMTHLRL